MTRPQTFGEAIARVRARIEETAGALTPPAEARRLLREAREIADAYASKSRALASIVERQRAVICELEATLDARRG